MKGKLNQLIKRALRKQHLQMIWLYLAVGSVVSVIVDQYFLKNNLISLGVGLEVSGAILIGISLREKKENFSSVSKDENN